MRVTGPEPTEVGPDGQLLWRVYDELYDLEPFVRSHPGGEIAIRLGQGIECTSLFESYHPARSSARDVLEKHRFRVNDVPDEVQGPYPVDQSIAADGKRPAAPAMSSFKNDLDEMVARHFAGKGRNAHKASKAHVLLCLCCFASELVCWVGWARGSWAAAVALPLLFWLTAVNVSHDASHMAFSAKGWLNELCAYAAFPLLYEPTTWYYMHVISHHVHTNDAAADADLQHFAPLKLHCLDKRLHPQGEARLVQFLKIVGTGFHLCLLVPLFQIDASRPASYQQDFSPAVWIPAGLKPHLKHRLLSLSAPLVIVCLIVYSLATFGLLKGVLFILLPWGLCSITFLLISNGSEGDGETTGPETFTAVSESGG